MTYIQYVKSVLRKAYFIVIQNKTNGSDTRTNSKFMKSSPIHINISNDNILQIQII